MIFTFADGAIVYKLRAPVTGIIGARFYLYLLLVHILDGIPPDAVSVLLTMIGNPSDAVQMLSTSIAALRSSGAMTWALTWSQWLALAYAQIGKSDEVWRCVSEALKLIEESNQRGAEAEVYRVAGEIALMSSEPDVAKAQSYFGRALVVANQQQAKSLELRTAMSLARLWRSQGKSQQARELLAPVYGWFTEGFDTLDLKEAKALLDEVHA